ncbi:MAG: HPF/RaiA family ribosome-associated protein [Holophaga sp.]|nr:HPF/RaiA family ribosome-associated protein [Holophaga sp.]
MKLDIKGIGFSATEAIRDRVARRLGVALSRRTDQVLRVVVRLQDLNGPKGGIDKHCRIEASLARRPGEVVEAISSDLYTAIDSACRRLGRAVHRSLERAES